MLGLQIKSIGVFEKSGSGGSCSGRCKSGMTTI